MANQTQKRTISSNLATLWDKDGKQLRITGNDESLGIGIWVPEVNAEGYRKYPIEKRFLVMLRPNMVSALAITLTKDFIDAYERGLNYKIAFPTNAAITSIMEVELVNGVYSISLIKGYNQATKEFAEKAVFTFSKNYITKTTEGETSTTEIDGEFYLFVKTIQSFAELASGTVAGHGTRVAGAYDNSTLFSYIAAIASKLQVEIPNLSYNRAASTPTQSSPSAPTGELAEIDNMTEFLK